MLTPEGPGAAQLLGLMWGLETCPLTIPFPPAPYLDLSLQEKEDFPSDEIAKGPRTSGWERSRAPLKHQH